MGQDTDSADYSSAGKNPPSPPTQESLDSLFMAARTARVFLGAKESGNLTDLRLVCELTGERLQILHEALRIPGEHEPRRCNCFGTLSIELVSDAGRVAILALHYHRVPLLSYVGWSHDAELGNRRDLFALLTKCGISPVLQEWEKELQEDEAERKRQMVGMWLRAGGIPLGDAMMRASKKQPE